jgi:RNA polymerase sigma factor (sigma-70 family)
MGPDTKEAPGAVAQPLFATTHWSVVLSTADQDSPEAAAALEQLCRTYWFPLYAYVRRTGYSPEDAEDLTQQFFARFVEKRSFGVANPARGRFRTFLLKSLQHFLADDWRRAHRVKRGGGVLQVPLDAVAAESRYLAEITDTMTPERAYEQHWASTLLEQVLEQMHQDYSRAGKKQLFEALEDLLWGPDPEVCYAVLAKNLGLTEGALRGAVFRLREHYRERLRAEVAHTVSAPGEIDAELHYLKSVIGGGR